MMGLDSNTHKGIKILLSILLGMIGVMSLMQGLASAEGEDQITASPAELVGPPADPLTLPFVYARVLTGPVWVYQSTTGITAVRSLDAGYLWVSLANAQPIYENNQGWYLINKDEYVRAEQLSIYTPSAFQGGQLTATPGKPFAWIVSNVWLSAKPGEAPASGAALLKRYTIVWIYEEQQIGDRMWYRVGEDQWLEQGHVGMVKPASRPEGVGPTDKWIDIDLYEQTLAAYEGDRMVYATLVSSGLPWWQTEQGLFRIWVKVKTAKMSGREGYPDYYFLEDVPWTMYFNRSFALHGAYWHDRFGFRHSHGCVNIAPKDAQWLFDWVTPATTANNWVLATEEEPGTWVWVHDDGPPAAR